MADKQPEALLALVLADEYARTKAKANLESIYGTSPSYSRQCESEAEEAREALEAALRRQHALIAELVGALEDAQAGLEFAGADKKPPTAFVPTPTLALRAVRTALAKAKEAQ